MEPAASCAMASNRAIMPRADSTSSSRLNCKVLLQFQGWPCHLHKCGHLPRTSSVSLIMAALTAGWHAQRRTSSQEAG
jgi:hypothetical protein